MPRCAFLSTDDLEGFCVYDHLAVPALNDRGIEVDEVPWRADVDWSQYAMVIVRSTWDYQQAPDAFLAALGRIDAATHLENPLAVMRGNIDKRYLGALAERGVRIVPTTFFDHFDADAIVRASAPFDRFVVKPAVGANADDVFVLERGADLDAVASTFATRPHLVQPFAEVIHTEGERSLFFFDGELSHAIVKRPADGDFRVQEEHGGRFELVTPTAAETEAGRRALGEIGERLLYARVDFVNWDGAPALMELELIEPSLYFEVYEPARAHFAEAVMRRLKP